MVEDAGVVHHTELRWPGGCGGLMMGDVGTSDDELHSRLPTGPVSVYIVCPDPDQLFERATHRGAEVLQGLEDEDYGSRTFTARDPEGNVWSFGTYRGSLATEPATENSASG